MPQVGKHLKISLKKVEILSSFTHVDYKPTVYDLYSSVEHKCNLLHAITVNLDWSFQK